MGELFNSMLRVPALIGFLRLVRRFKFPVLCKAASNQRVEHSVQPDLEVLNCRVQLMSQDEDGRVFDIFAVEIRGSIHAPSDMHNVVVRILIADVTDRISKARPVHSRIKQWQKQDSPTFCYNADLGKIPDADTNISDWMTVGRLRLNWLVFPRKGERSLQVSTSILSAQNGEELASATSTITYENSEFGYINLQENIQQAKTLAVALAFAVSAADRKLYSCEIELIKNWAKESIDFSKVSNEAERELEKALDKTVCFFRGGNQLDTYGICKRIIELAPIAVRYDILNLCLRVVGANGVATAEELGLLKNLASWLDVDMDRFREMMGKVLPVSMHEEKDLEFILGVGSDMSEKENRRRLNKEYRKWNARVTNSDPEIRVQADYMLNFIAEARSGCVG